MKRERERESRGERERESRGEREKPEVRERDSSGVRERERPGVKDGGRGRERGEDLDSCVGDRNWLSSLHRSPTPLLLFDAICIYMSILFPWPYPS